jgi:hypothetical protein
MLGRLIRAHPVNVVERAEYETLLARWRRGETVPLVKAGSPQQVQNHGRAEVDLKMPTIEIEVEAPTFEAKVKAPAIEVKVKAPAIEIEVKAPAISAEVLAEVHLSAEDLLAEFDHVDKDCTGFAPRDELITHLVTSCLPQSPSCAGLIDLLKGLGDVMILEREDFGELIGKLSSKPDPAHTKPAPPSPLGDLIQFSDEDLCNEFDKVDEDDTGFAARLDLHLHFQKHILPSAPSVHGLIELIKSQDTLIVEKDQFEELLETWRAQ